MLLPKSKTSYTTMSYTLELLLNVKSIPHISALSQDIRQHTKIT